MRATWLLLGCVIATGCSDDGGQRDATCTCKAMAVSFDRASSMLGADNVQDALDELAARAVPEAPIGSRIETLTKSFPNPGTSGGVNQTADCPEPMRDLALGGACGFVDNASIVQTKITNDAQHSSYTCGWDQPNGGSGSMTVTVVCLRGAR